MFIYHRAAFELTEKDVLPFRIHGGLKGGHSDGTSAISTFGYNNCPYKAIHSTDADVIVRIVCERELGSDELPYPMSDEDAEEYAMDEHHVSIPIADWSKSSEAPMRIGEFLFCRSPELISQINTRRDRPDVLDLSPQNLFAI